VGVEGHLHSFCSSECHMMGKSKLLILKEINTVIPKVDCTTRGGDYLGFRYEARRRHRGARVGPLQPHRLLIYS
jgi:hypothetical protein